MTTNEVDRDKDIVETSGIDTKSFEDNPVVLWAHDPSQPPIGTVTDMERQPNMLLGTVKFADTSMGNEIFKLYADGIMKTWSIGFQGTSVDYLKDAEGDITGYHFQKSELYELSAVPVPANPSALVRACKGIKDLTTRKELEKLIPKKKEDTYLLIDTETRLVVDGEEKELKGISLSSFTKTTQEAGLAGKLPVDVSFSDQKGHVKICFEILQKNEEVITECKIKSISVVISTQKAEALTLEEEPSRKSEKVEDQEIVEEDCPKAKGDELKAIAEMKESLLKSISFC